MRKLLCILCLLATFCHHSIAQPVGYSKPQADARFSSKVEKKALLGTGVDSTAINTTDKFLLGYSAGFVLDTIIFSMRQRGGTPDVTAKISFGTDFSAVGTSVVTAGTRVTSYTSVTRVSTFNNSVIYPGNLIWLTFSSVTVIPKGFFVILIGHKN
jgi:hypothetical protein